MGIESMRALAEMAKPRVIPPLDDSFRSAALANRAFRRAVEESGNAVPFVIGLERGDGTRSRYDTKLFAGDHPMASLNLPYAERLVKFLLWQKGAWRVTVGGPSEIGGEIEAVYSPNGARSFDWEFMGNATYERPFEVDVTDADSVPAAREVSVPLGRHLEGCRIGFDLGASDRKVAAVIDGDSIFTQEVVWDPRNQTDPQYHYEQIMDGLRRAAASMPRVDAIGGSSAGVIINSRPMVASLFRGVPRPLFETGVKSIFLRMRKEWGVPFEVANDGDVTALAGAMSLNDCCVLGVAMGSSEAAGYVNEDGNITGWLNELAFAPIDYNPDAPADEWSGDTGCGVQYLTQQAVFRLAAAIGIELDQSATPAAQLEYVQGLLRSGDERARRIWETIGCYTGYTIAHYAEFYTIKHMLILGRVTSGEGGPIILSQAKRVIQEEFPDLLSTIELHLPDEETRRVGQAVAAASLPAIQT
ncbi:MAG: ROK family protein [Armatimonadota bacterium]|nr:ROK family protein [Armatimonadota bacterium]